MSDIWRKDYNEFYKNHADKNKFVYKIDWCKSFISQYVDKPSKKTSLIDVGCGDGVWSMVLSDYYNVTAIDNSIQGINNAKKAAIKYKKNINFICNDIQNIDDKYDVVFCRCPSFFGGYAPDDKVFQKFLPIVMNLCKKTLYFIVYSRPPFSTYANEKKTSYYHDPNILKNLFENYGKVELKYERNYIILKINIG